MNKQMILTTSTPWRDETGSGVHKLSVIVEFTGCDWKTLEILSESGRPSFANPLTTTGAVSPLFINNPAMLARLGYKPIAQ